VGVGLDFYALDFVTDGFLLVCFLEFLNGYFFLCDLTIDLLYLVFGNHKLAFFLL
jgi:hypothetical protein